MGFEQVPVAISEQRRHGEVSRPGLCASSHGSLRHRTQYSGHPHQIRRRHRELEVLIDSPDPSVHGLGDAPHRLSQAEVLLDALAYDLADPVTGVSSRAPVDRAAALIRFVGRHVWRDTALAPADEVLVSQTVKDLVAGSGLEFEDFGMHSLKGVADSWHLYAVKAIAPA